MTAACGTQLIPVASLRDWFRSSIQTISARQNLRANPQTEHYIVDLLIAFARSENFYEHHQQGFGLRPLAIMLADALESPNAMQRNLTLQRLGDVSLFAAGFFPESLARRSVDVDYYSHMGGIAYETLSGLPPQSRRQEALTDVFRELAVRFGVFVDLLSEIAQMARVFTQEDVLRLYDLWIKTGSERAAVKLRELGIQPAASSVSRRQH